jgi:hypothetical protein
MWFVSSFRFARKHVAGVASVTGCFSAIHPSAFSFSLYLNSNGYVAHGFEAYRPTTV